MWQLGVLIGFVLVIMCALAGLMLFWSIKDLRKIEFGSYTKPEFIVPIIIITSIAFLEIMICTEIGGFLDTLMPASSILMIVSIILLIISIIINIISIIKCSNTSKKSNRS